MAPKYFAKMIFSFLILFCFAGQAMAQDEADCSNGSDGTDSSENTESQWSPLDGFNSIDDFIASLWHRPLYNGIYQESAKRWRIVRYGLKFLEDVDGQENVGRRSTESPIDPDAIDGIVLSPTPTAIPADLVDEGTDDIYTNPSTCSGVIPASGNYTRQAADATVRGLYSMQLTRNYSSGEKTGHLFGPHWTSNFDPYRVVKSLEPCVITEVGCVPPSATVTFPNGDSYVYTMKADEPS